MGRYTTVQTYSDNNPNAPVQSYEQATGGGRDYSKEGEPSQKKLAVQDKVDVVDNVSGSTAGAGSGEFHVYRAQRRREYERLAKMDADHAKSQAAASFQASLDKNRAECEEKTRARAEKRKRKKLKELAKRAAAKEDKAKKRDGQKEASAAAVIGSGSGAGAGGGGSREQGDEALLLVDKDGEAHSTAKGLNKVADDGSFMAAFAKGGAAAVLAGAAKAAPPAAEEGAAKRASGASSGSSSSSSSSSSSGLDQEQQGSAKRAKT
eukprot:g1705.t1